MKVAIIEPVGGHGGMNYYDFSLAEGLVAAGAEIIVYTCDKTDVSQEFNFEIKRIFKRIWGSEHKSSRAFRFAHCLLKTLIDARRENVELIHYHFFHYTPMESFCVWLAHLFRFPIVITVHDLESFAGHHSNLAAQRILVRADKIIAHNIASQRELIKKTNLPTENISIIPHGNYLDTIPKTPFKKEARNILQLAPDDHVLLFFGQIKEVKGLDLLLQALPKVITEIPNLKLVIAGKVWKDDFSKYENLVQKNNLQENICFHIGYIPDIEVATYYRAADLVVLPYRRIYQSGVLLMAMSYDVPVVVSDLDGMIEIIQHRQNGFVFQNGNPTSLSEQIIHALSNHDQLNQISQKAHETVAQKHSWEMIGQMTFKLYQAIIKQK